ncbi:MAG: hypothetical protein MUC77_16885 [Chromatiaceae bacterium]|jgi:NADH:ubiquinone oxidoreductase subunit 2 (subunit N)|nr:hypothetical protein [Chromatiaceae bacterium]
MPEALFTLIPLPPLLAALWIALGFALGRDRGEAGERGTARVALSAAGLSLLLVLAADVQALLLGPPGQIEAGTWLASGGVRVALGLRLDAFGLVMATLVALIGLVTLRFSVHYLHREPGFQRFFLGMSLFTSAMLLIVTAGNAVLTFVGWELAGVSSYLLIGYAYERPRATDNANRAFLTNRIGDAGFLLAIALCFAWVGGVEWPQITEGATDLSALQLGLILFGFLLAALAKSAQVPFSAWILRALEGPTPSSAAFYGSLMVHAGVYLLIRLAPLLELAPALAALVALLGLATALYGWLGALTAAETKGSLMYATLAQVGLMVLWCGLGWTELAAWHLVVHALWRAYHFLHAPALMHWVPRPARPVPAWLARRRWLYTAALNGFWLDAVGDALALRPARQLARDVESFEERVVHRLVGLPEQGSGVHSLARWEEARLGRAAPRHRYGPGVLGALMDSLSTALHWFEQRMVLQSGGGGLRRMVRVLGGYLQEVEALLSQPRYLVLLILATLVVIL